MKKFIILLLTLFLSGNAMSKPIDKSPALYVIVSPMESEAQFIRSHMTDKKEIDALGIHYLKGKIHNREVLSVVSGYGKVNVTTVVSRLFASFHPNAIILAESAGGVNKNLKIGDVVIGTTLFDADFGELTSHGPELPILIDNPINNKKEPLVYKGDAFLLEKAKLASSIVYKLVFGVIADSDFLPNPDWQLKLLRDNHVEAVSMDGVAVTKLAWLFNTPSLVLHSIANIAGQPIDETNTTIAANNMGEVVVNLLERLPQYNRQRP